MIAAALLLVLAALPATAPAQTRGPSLTLYDQPDFQGRSVTLFTDKPDLTDTGAVGRSRSLRIAGRWRVCEAPGGRGRCQVLDRNIADLAALGLAGRVVSAAIVDGYGRETYEPEPYTPPPSGYGREDYSRPSEPPPMAVVALPPPAHAYPASPRARGYGARPFYTPAHPVQRRVARLRQVTPRTRLYAAQPPVVAPPAVAAPAPVVQPPKPKPFAPRPAAASAPKPLFAKPPVGAAQASAQAVPAAPPPASRNVPDYGGGPAFGPASR